MPIFWHNSFRAIAQLFEQSRHWRRYSGLVNKPQGERRFIQSVRTRAGRAGGALRVGIGDDAAVLRPKGKSEIVVTTDFSLENKHFRRDWHPAKSAGHRCLARGLSDLAAMGARPMAVFLSLAIPAGTMEKTAGKKWVDGFLEGVLELAKASGVKLGGGDTATAPGEEILADIVLLGSVPRGRALLRSGAKVGDSIYVTGTLGAAAVELEVLSDDPKKFARSKVGDKDGHPHLFPQPRLNVGRALIRRGGKDKATAAIDLSDGLSTDLMHLCEESGVAAVVDATSIPLGGTLLHALHGGEDYELLFTGKKLPKNIAGVQVTKIGTIEKAKKNQPPVRIRMADGTESALLPMGWEHQI